jgi:LPPG:FO 2-phospho-L-lactate transferase
MTVVALAGGVGGAKLADGLAHLLGETLTVVVNTGDDFEHLGFSISPDLDTVMYTLAQIADLKQGWGLAGETWNFMDQVMKLGGPGWFRLGDRDIATHAFRTDQLRSGMPLTAVTAELCRALGIGARILPMSDDPVRTIVHSQGTTLPFQEYFVRLQCQVPVDRLHFQGAENARLNAALAGMLAAPTAIVLCPSNPYLSIDPILAVPGMRQWLAAWSAPIVAVSPIVGGRAIKGPAAKIMQELGHDASTLSVAKHYRGLITGLVIDNADADLCESIRDEGIAVRVTSTIMRDRGDRIALARETLAFAAGLASGSSPLVLQRPH